jgi:hypothetical protein
LSKPDVNWGTYSDSYLSLTVTKVTVFYNFVSAFFFKWEQLSLSNA